MSAMRSTAGVAVLNSRLYVVGGRDGSLCHRSVECYDPHTNKWSARAPMNKRRGGVGVGVANGFLYALGGHDCPASNPSVCRTETVERYDTVTDTWTMVSGLEPPLHGNIPFTPIKRRNILRFLSSIDCFVEYRARCNRCGAIGRMADCGGRVRWHPIFENGGEIRQRHKRMDTFGPIELQSGRSMRCGRAESCASLCQFNSLVYDHIYIVFSSSNDMLTRALQTLLH